MNIDSLNSDIFEYILDICTDEIEYDILNQIKKFDGSAHAK